MDSSFVIFGLIYDLIGVLILVLVTIIGARHQKIHDPKQPKSKKYWWQGWRPTWRDTKTGKRRWKSKHTTVRYGAIPPKYQWNAVGVLFIILGFSMQIWGNLR